MDSVYITALSCLSAHFKMLHLAFNSINQRCTLQSYQMEQESSNVLERKKNDEFIHCVHQLQNLLE